MSNNKIIIYQMMTRLFGNINTTNAFYGSLEENGVGKFKDINDKALNKLKRMGISHVWYTGVIEHALMTDYTSIGIPLDDIDVIKGRAGSPYAIKDYYDVNPDLANNPKKRIDEFDRLIKRTHKHNLKVIIDFVPNHVARAYCSDAKPDNVDDLGQNDNKNVSFYPNNNFYYINKPFIVPADYNAGGPDFTHFYKDKIFNENPAKATGNDVFSAEPSINDWFETVKLNYGVDYFNNNAKFFYPTPDTWIKMTDILLFWASKGIDGFRCDMVEMVPVEFWNYAIPIVKEKYPHIIFIGEAYNPNNYAAYFDFGYFDYLYDKVGIYDTLKAVIQKNTSVSSIYSSLNSIEERFKTKMLNFLENHDEQRIASPFFAGDAKKGIPMMIVSATISDAAVMIYFGQEVGEPAALAEGFSGNDGRTSIFDYCSAPEFVKWVNNHKYNDDLLSDEQKYLRNFYSKLLNICADNSAFYDGKHYAIEWINNNNKSEGFNDYLNMAYIRYNQDERFLVIVTFDDTYDMQTYIKFNNDIFNLLNLDTEKEYKFTDLLNSGFNSSIKGAELLSNEPNGGLKITVPKMNGMILKF